MVRKTACCLALLLSAVTSATFTTTADAQTVTVKKSAEEKTEELVIHLDDSNFEETVKASEVPVLVDFYATWCEPCKRMAPRLETLAKEYEGKLLVVKVDAERSPKLAAKYGIKRYPTLYLLKPGGGTIKSSTGEKSLDGLREFVKDALKK
jgi:thioredoxin 1